MLKDIESVMDDMLENFKIYIPQYVSLMNTEKGDNILDSSSIWYPQDDAFYQDSLMDFPPYSVFFLLFIATDPLIKSQNPSFDAIETYTLGFTVAIADDMEADRNYYKVKKRYNRIIKQVIINEFTKIYSNYKITIKDSKSEVITSPNGVIYEASAVFFDVTLTIV